jgi:hypothetical protein
MHPLKKQQYDIFTIDDYILTLNFVLVYKAAINV